MTRRCLIATSQTWPSTAVLPAMLVEAGATVVAFSPGPLGLSGHVAERIRCSRDPASAAAHLRSLLARRSFDLVVVADEMLLASLFESRDARVPAPWLPIDPTDEAAVALLLSKHNFVERGRKLGLRIPESLVVASAAGAVHAAEEIGYPVIVKGDRGFGGLQVRVCENAGAVATAGAELFEQNTRLVVQRCVSGERVSACVLYDRGRVVAYSAYRALCCHPHAFSASTVHECFEHPDILPAAVALGTATSFHGMAGIDFMNGADGILYAIEINPRPTMGFGGTAENRTFWAAALGRVLRREAPGNPEVFLGRQRVQSYFPSFLFYLVSNLNRNDAAMRRWFFACLREARLVDAGPALWELMRFLYEHAAMRVPALRRFGQKAAPVSRANVALRPSAEPIHVRSS